ncbi:MAG: hypothetical protein JOY78_13785 [Pseudonocardia sp.]|nr:hypothetical protein [Pseudonocardia sp.]
MYDPPPGYDDMAGDSQLAAFNPVFEDLEVPKVGTVRARRPRPNAIHTLAMAANAANDAPMRADHVVLFAREHLEDGELDRLFVAMVSNESIPSDAVERIVRELATWGTSRPYSAVITLAVMSAFHWRTIRLKLQNNGILDPMALPSMHRILDATEAAILEAMVSSKPDEDRQQRQRFLDRLYAPTAETNDLNGDGYRPQPAGFEPDEVETAFDSLLTGSG